MIKSYFVLRHHVDLVTARYNYFHTYGNEVERRRINDVIIPITPFVSILNSMMEGYL